MEDKRQIELDSVTVGEIRAYMNEHLERQIIELGDLVRKGYHTMHEVTAYIEKDIAPTLCLLNNVNSFASNVLMKRTINGHKEQLRKGGE